MRRGINLAHGKKPTDKLLKRAYSISIVLFAGSVLVAIILLAYRLILNISFNSLSTKEDSIRSQVLALQVKRDKYIETKARLSEISKIINRRSTTPFKVDTLTSIVPSDTLVSGVSGSDTEIDLSVTADNLASLNDLIEQKIIQLASDKKKGIKKVELRSFGLDTKTLGYKLTLAVTF